MKRPKPLEVTREEIRALRDRAKRGELRPEDAKLVESLAETVVVLSEAVEKKGTSIRRLLRLLFGSKSESKGRLFGKNRDGDGDPPGVGAMVVVVARRAGDVYHALLTAHLLPRG